MNDGDKQPRRSILSYILPYLLMGLTIGLFIWLIVSQLSTGTDTWYVSQLDEYLGYSSHVVKNEEDGSYEAYYDYESTTDRTIVNVSVSQSYKAVTVTGTYVNQAQSTRYFTVTMEEEKWNSAFDSVISYTADSTTYSITVQHASYSTIFTARATGVISVTDAFAQSWWDVWGPTIIMMGVVILIGIFFYSRLNASVNGANRQAMDFNRSPAKKDKISNVKFDDVAGCDEEKAEMVELVEYLKEPQKYSKLGARLPKGVLLIGNPGTGKTLLAKAVAGEAKVPFFNISGSDFVEMYVGVGASRVRNLFRQAKQNAPCVVFIDEIDAVGRQRGAGLGGGNDEREQTLNQLLVEMDGFAPNSGVLIIAATNRQDILDPALRRPGRFDRTVTVSLPDKKGREAIFKVHARNKKIDPNIDWGALAKRTVGFSGADIDNVLNEAAILAVRRNHESVKIEDIDEAIDRVISGPAKNGQRMTDHERKTVAYHEAGHAVIGLNLPHSDKVQKITIIPRGNTGGHVLMTPEDDRFLLTKSELLARITGLLGGRTSEEIFFQDVSTGASNDIQEATRLARLMVTEFGMSELGPIQYENATGSVFLGRDYTNTQKNFSTQVAYEIDKAVRQIIDDAHEQARKLLTEKKDQVILIAETLLENETITAEEIDELLANGKIAKHDRNGNIVSPDTPVEKPAEAEVVEAPKAENDPPKGE